MGIEALEDAKKALETLDTDLVVAAYHSTFLFEDVPSSKHVTDKAVLRAYFETLFALPGVAFSDITVHEGEGFGVIEWTWSGTSGPAGAPYRVRGVSIIELTDGKIARETLYYDPRPALS